MSRTKPPQECDSPSCGCRGSITRRDFVEMLGWGTAAALTTGMPVMAGPFEAADFEKLIPADKKLDAAWVKSLFARGARTVYRGAELEKIGMPIGGICAGQVYLGGDGTLWHWDIFNQHIGTSVEHYARPPQPASPLAQGFGLRVSAGGKTDYRPLNRKGFAEIAFSGEYPIGWVEYRDPATPLAVSLEAFSPFVPLDAEELESAGDHPAVDRQERGRHGGRGGTDRLARKRRLLGHEAGRPRPAAKPHRPAARRSSP